MHSQDDKGLIAGNGPGDVLVVASGEHRADRLVFDAVVPTAVHPVGADGGTADGEPCEAKRFE
jgi:hypothetical protein